MTQFRRVDRSGRVLLASAAVLALSLVGYGNAATASVATPLALGVKTTMDQAGPVNGGSATVTTGSGIGKGEDSGKPPTGGRTGTVVAHCVLGAPTRMPPHTILKSTTVRGGPVVIPRTDPSMRGGASTSVAAMGSGISVTVDPPDAVAVPDLRKGLSGVKGFVAPDTGRCSAPEPMPNEPGKKPPLGRPAPGPAGRPVVTTCTDPAPDLPGDGAGVSTSKPGALPGPDAGQAKDQAVGVRAATCLQSEGDQPVSSPADDVPPTGSTSGAGDAVAAQEDGASASTR